MTRFSEVVTAMEGFRVRHVFDVTPIDFHDIQIGMPIHIKFKKAGPNEYEAMISGQIVIFRVFDEIPAFETEHHVSAIYTGNDSNKIFDYSNNQ